MTNGSHGAVLDDIALLALDYRRRQESHEILAAASAVLGRSLDLRETADAMARAAIPRFADWAVVDAIDENGQLARLALAHADPDLQAAAESIDRRWPPRLEYAAAANAVFATGEPVLLSDFRDEYLAGGARDAEHFAALCTFRVRSCVSVPLQAAGQRLGVLTLLTTEGGRRYTAADLPLAVELAQRAANALVNARLFARVLRAHVAAESARDGMERLQKLSAELTSSLTPDAVVDVVVRHVALALGARSAAVFELSEDGREFRLLGTANVDATSRARAALLPVDTLYPIGEVARTGESVLIEDADAWWAAHPGVPMVGSAERAWAALPLRVEEGENSRLLGALSVTFAGPHTFPEEERRFLQTFADLCAQALDRARLFDAEAAARILAERLQALIGALADVRTVDEIAQAVGREARQAVGASAAGLALLADEGSSFSMKILAGVDDALREEWRTFPNEPTIPYGAVVAARTPLFFPNVATYVERFPDLERALTAGTLQAAALVPLVGGDGRPLGAIHFAFDAPRAFSTVSRQAFLSIAQQCTAALERVRLYESERAHAAAVTARVQAEAARAVAEAASHAKDQLLAFVSHELRAPLAPARALAQVLARSGTLTPDDRETVEEIERHIGTEARLVDSLLEFERAGRGLLTVQCGRCDLRDVARRALRTAGPALRQKRIDVTEDFAAEESVAWADPLRLQEIVGNLLSNAAKFSSAGTALIVSVRNPVPGWIELTVADAGHGISRDDLARLFTPFTQLGGPRSRHSGLGLGLAISRHLAELQGGTLTAASGGLGRGATFTLRVRTARAVTREPLERSIDRNESVAFEPAADDDRALRILVLEDDRSTAVALRRLLSTHGHQVYVADSLATAEEIVCAEAPDVLLSDLQLMGESGLDAPRRVADAARRCGRSAPPAVVLSGFSREGDVAQARAAGFVSHLAKPIDEDSLLQALRNAVRVASQTLSR